MYQPKFYNNYTEAVSIIKSNLPLDIVDSIEEETIGVHLQQTEIGVIDFLESAGLDPEALGTKEKANAQILHTFRTLLSLLTVFPKGRVDRDEFRIRFEEVVRETELRLMSMKFPIRLVTGIMKRIPPEWGRYKKLESWE